MEPIKIEQKISFDIEIYKLEEKTISIDDSFTYIMIDIDSIPELISALQKFYEDGK